MQNEPSHVSWWCYSHNILYAQNFYYPNLIKIFFLFSLNFSLLPKPYAKEKRDVEIFRMLIGSLLLHKEI